MNVNYFVNDRRTFTEPNKEEEFKKNFRKIRAFIKKATELGYEPYIVNRERWDKEDRSWYIGFSKIGLDTTDFIFRFSDHFLTERNQIPAGVIDTYAGLDIEGLEFYHKTYTEFSEEEKNYLWTNRPYSLECLKDILFCNTPQLM